MNDTPQVSVIIPLYNATKHLREAVASLRLQDWPSLQMIFVDDGSTDGSGELARELAPDGIHLRQENGGPASARNRGLAAATGDVIAFLDADDEWPAGKLARQVSAMYGNPGHDIVTGNVQRFRETPGGREYLDPCFVFLLGGMVCRRTVLDRVGNFNTGMRHGFSDDTDWTLRAWEAGLRILFQREISISYRVHGESLTNGMDIRSNGFLLALQMSLARRRAAGGNRAKELPAVDAREAIIPANPATMKRVPTES